MFQLVQMSTAELIVKKSRFLATALPVADEAEARRAIATHSVDGATHNCWAYRAGAACRFSDDGEPGGTAGRPILAAIDGQAFDGVALVVTRWFGGVLLGTGGLVRAYGGAAAAALKAGERIAVAKLVEGTLDLTFSDLALVKARLLAVPDVRFVNETFHAEGAHIDAQVPEAEIERLMRMVTDLTSGRGRLVRPD